MKGFFHQLLTLPTWLIMMMLWPFLPATHKWKVRRPTLSNWAEYSTEQNNHFSFFLWFTGPMWLVIFLVVFLK